MTNISESKSGVFFFLLFVFFSSLQPANAQTYIVATQNLPYYPHYDLSSPKDKGYAWALLESFAASKGIHFEYVSMPVLRLQIELAKGNVDLVYPDHPSFTNPVIDNSEKFYSVPLTETLVGTFVKSEHYGRDINDINKVAIVLGFSPLYWQKRIDAGLVTLLTVADNKAAIDMVELHRADAFDMDYYVAQHMLAKLKNINNYVLDPALPVTVTEFCVSTIKYPDLTKELSEFIADNPVFIESLKARYGISDPHQQLEFSKNSHN
ncbi:MAG: hypothetical protein HWE26_14775 [Alteromonadaceae bacterium]|nr:hypothetical protein [Alteromonadaceae bacterium]